MHPSCVFFVTMAIDPKTLHPTVWKEVDRLVAEGYWGQGSGLQGQDKSAISEHNTVWMKEYGTGCALKSAGIVGVAGAIIALTPEVWKAPAFFLAISLAVCAFGYLIWENSRQITRNELKALAPALHLTPIQKQYVDAVLILESVSLAEDTKKEVVQQLNRLMDEEVHLREMREKGGLGSPAQDLSYERTEILRNLEASTDSISRETLTRSLEICDARIAASTEKSVVVQRIDSQLMMISQSMGNMRDMLGRLQTLPMTTSVDIDLSPIRHAIESAQNHANALEAAVNEIQSVGK